MTLKAKILYLFKRKHPHRWSSPLNNQLSSNHTIKSAFINKDNFSLEPIENTPAEFLFESESGHGFDRRELLKTIDENGFVNSYTRQPFSANDIQYLLEFPDVNAILDNKEKKFLEQKKIHGTIPESFIDELIEIGNILADDDTEYYLPAANAIKQLKKSYASLPENLKIKLDSYTVINGQLAKGYSHYSFADWFKQLDDDVCHHVLGLKLIDIAMDLKNCTFSDYALQDIQKTRKKPSISALKTI